MIIRFTPFLTSRRQFFLLVSCWLLGALLHVNAASQELDYPPSADLVYSLKSSQRGIPLRGEAKISWQISEPKNAKRAYKIQSETTVPLFGKILSTSSLGEVDLLGLAPQQFIEKRFRKAQASTTFDRANKTIRFSDSDLTYPITGGEQDRLSATWQLVALVRGNPDSLVAGHEWSMFVAGLRDAEPWTFKLIGFSKIATALGEQDVVHIAKAPPPDAKGQQLDIWLAVGLGYYPVRISFSDANGDQVDQRIAAIKK